MSVISGQTITDEFVTSSFTTGAATDADSTPTGVLYLNGTANGASVTVTNLATGLYKFAVTLPTLAQGDCVSVVISATVGSVAAKGVVWSDNCGNNMLAATQLDKVTFNKGVAINQSTSNAAALTITGNGSGAGVAITGGASGYGMDIVGPGNMGVSITTSGNYGVYLNATGNYGFFSQGGYNGGMFYGADGHGIEFVGTSGNGVYVLSGSNDAMVLFPGSTYNGIHAYGGQTSGAAIQCDTNGSGNSVVLNQGMVINAQTNQAAVAITGNGSGNGLTIAGGSTGHGISSIGGSGVSDTYGAYLVGGSGANGRGLYAVGQNGGYGAEFDGGPTGHGIYAIGGGDDQDTYGAYLIGGNGANGRGLVIQGFNAGPGVQIGGGTTGDGVHINAGGSGGNSLYLQAPAGNGLAVEGSVHGGYFYTNGGGNALWIHNDGGGTALSVQCNSGIAFFAEGSTYGMYVHSTGGNAAWFQGATNGLVIYGQGGNALELVSTGTGAAGLYILSGGGDGVQVYPGATYDGFKIYGGYDSGHAIHLLTNGSGNSIVAEQGIVVTNSQANQPGVTITGNGAADGLQLRSGESGGYGICSAGQRGGIRAMGQGANSVGMLLRGGTDGNGFDTAGNGTGFGMQVSSWNVTGVTNLVGAVTADNAGNNITGVQINPASIWQDTTPGDFTVPGSIGKSLFTDGAVPGAAGGLALVGSEMDLIDNPNQTAQNHLATSLLDLANGVETDWTLRQSARIWNSYMFGLTTVTDLGGGNERVTFRDPNNTVTRIDGTVTIATKERTNVTTDAS